MRILRLSLEEYNEDMQTVHRAEKVFSELEWRHFYGNNFLDFQLQNLEKEIEAEKQKQTP